MADDFAAQVVFISESLLNDFKGWLFKRGLRVFSIPADDDIKTYGIGPISPRPSYVITPLACPICQSKEINWLSTPFVTEASVKCQRCTWFGRYVDLVEAND